MKQLVRIISNQKAVVVIILLLAAVASFQSYYQKNKAFTENGPKYTAYNNYIIFKQSFNHLVENKDLYQLYPEEHWDYYKYSPTFAMFFGIFAIFPDLIGLNLWNLFNCFIFLLAIYYLPWLSKLQKGLVSSICLIELMTATQNEQSNALVAGLIILTFGLLEKRKYLFACLCVIFSIYIKIFGVVGLALFLFYPKKWKLAAYSAGWALVLLVLPLLITGAEQLKFLYSSWSNLLDNDHSISYGYSVIGWIHSWFGVEMNKLAVVLAGAVLFLIPLARWKEFGNFQFRLLTLSSILIWIVIFNHKAESPTFIIAMAGIALWYVTAEKSTINTVLFIFAFILTSLSPTDLFPVALRENFVKPYVLKAFPCILIWLKVVYDMLGVKVKSLEFRV